MRQLSQVGKGPGYNIMPPVLLYKDIRQIFTVQKHSPETKSPPLLHKIYSTILVAMTGYAWRRRADGGPSSPGKQCLHLSMHTKKVLKIRSTSGLWAVFSVIFFGLKYIYMIPLTGNVSCTCEHSVMLCLELFILFSPTALSEPPSWWGWVQGPPWLLLYCSKDTFLNIICVFYCLYTLSDFSFPHSNFFFFAAVTTQETQCPSRQLSRSLLPTHGPQNPLKEWSWINQTLCVRPFWVIERQAISQSMSMHSSS